MNIYLDIDGVILANEKQPANHVKEFLKYVTDTYPTYWLTTHCKGDSGYTISHLSRVLDGETIEIAKKVNSTNWETSKTEAIDFTEPFLWFDDMLFDLERNDLIEKNALRSWVEVDFSKDIDSLEKFIQNFPKLISRANEEDLLGEAISVTKEYPKVSPALLQRLLSINYIKAARLMIELEQSGYIAKSDGTAKPRRVLNN